MLSLIHAIINNIDPIYFVLLSRLNSVWNEQIMKRFDTPAGYKNFLQKCDPNKMIEYVFNTTSYFDICLKSIKFGFGFKTLNWINFVVKPTDDNPHKLTGQDYYYDKYMRNKNFERLCVLYALEYNNVDIVMNKCGKYHTYFRSIIDYEPTPNYIVEELIYALHISKFEIIKLLLIKLVNIGCYVSVSEYDSIFESAMKREDEIIIIVYNFITECHNRMLKAANAYDDPHKIELVTKLLTS